MHAIFQFGIENNEFITCRLKEFYTFTIKGDR